MQEKLELIPVRPISADLEPVLPYGMGGSALIVAMVGWLS